MKLFPLNIIALVCVLSTSALYADILITKLNDIDISVSGNGFSRDVVVTERFCVASDPVGLYSLVAYGSGDNGEFSLANGPYSIAYQISYRDRRSNSGFIELLPGIATGGFLTRPLRGNQNCPGNPGRLRVTILRSALNSAVAGGYSGTLQLSVVPE